HGGHRQDNWLDVAWGTLGWSNRSVLSVVPRPPVHGCSVQSPRPGHDGENAVGLNRSSRLLLRAMDFYLESPAAFLPFYHPGTPIASTASLRSKRHGLDDVALAAVLGC